MSVAAGAGLAFPVNPMLGTVLNREIHERLSGSLALATLAAWMGAAIVRVHDVSETIDVVRITRAVRDVAYNQAD